MKPLVAGILACLSAACATSPVTSPATAPPTSREAILANPVVAAARAAAHDPRRKWTGDGCLIEIRPNAARTTQPFTAPENLPGFLARVEGGLPPAIDRKWGFARVVSERSPLMGQRVFIFGNFADMPGSDNPDEPFLLLLPTDASIDPSKVTPSAGNAGYGQISLVSCPTPAS